MNQDTILRAKAEALQFIERADEMLNSGELSHRGFVCTGTRLTGSLRRQSLELTRSLADMRRPK